MAAVEDDLTRGMVEESFKGAIINLKKIDWLTRLADNSGQMESRPATGHI